MLTVDPSIPGLAEKKRAEEIARTRRFRVDDIPLLTSVFRRNASLATPEWALFADATLDLPDWFDGRLDPDSPEYKAQQLKLWRVISGRDRPGEPADEEDTVAAGVDAVRFPGFFGNRGANAVAHAGDHMMAMATMLKHSKAKPGSWALEYGAGFGQTALALSRLGVNVDTVDSSTSLCKCVKDAADFFGTALTPFRGVFGDNPRPGQKYDLILFHEAFHHSVDFHQVVGKLREHLAPGGRVMLCGEPILPGTCPAIPYPWGMRLDARTVVMARSAGALELGFTHPYILDVFARHDFIGDHIPCPSNALADLYCFQPVEPGHFLPQLTMQHEAAKTWHVQEPNGRWTTGRSEFHVPLDQHTKQISLDVQNVLPVRKKLTIENAGKAYSFVLKAKASKTISIPKLGDPKLVILSDTHSPLELSVSPDPRQLGVFVTAVYCS